MTKAEQIRTIVAFAEERLGLKITICTRQSRIVNRQEDLGDVGYVPGHIYFHKSAFVGWLMHEMAHWLVATPHERTLSNYGFDRHSFYTRTSRESQASVATGCLWRLIFPEEEEVFSKIWYELGTYPSLDDEARVEKLVRKAERRHEKEKKAELLRKAQALLSVLLGETSNT